MKIDPAAQVTEHLEGLDKLATYCLELEIVGQAHLYQYSDADIMNAIFVFNHVVSNRLAHNQIKSGQLDPEIALHVGNKLHDLIVEITGFDPREYFKEKKK